MHFPSILFQQVVCLTCSLSSDGNKLSLEGQHNYDAGWVSELQNSGSLVNYLSVLLNREFHTYYVGQASVLSKMFISAYTYKDKLTEFYVVYLV